MTTPQDVPAEVHHLHIIWANWRNSIKTSNGYNWTAREAQETIDMAVILRGGASPDVGSRSILYFLGKTPVATSVGARTL